MSTYSNADFYGAVGTILGVAERAKAQREAEAAKKAAVAVEAPTLDIVKWDDARLTQVCEPLAEEEFGPELEAYTNSMIATMQKHNGWGLAGPQVGFMKRVFVMSFPDHEDVKPIAVCNPELVFIKDDVVEVEREGCLSLKDIFEQVQRPRHVTVEFRRPDGSKASMPLVGIEARVAQHEYDHLEGKMFFDRMSRQMRKAVLRQWEKKGKK